MVTKNFEVKVLEAETGEYSVVIHKENAESLGLHADDRVEIGSGKNNLVAVIETTSSLVNEGEIGTFSEVTEKLNLSGGNKVSLSPAPRPKSISYIRKMMKGNSLSEEEIRSIVSDIVERRLTSSEMTAFLVTEEVRGMSVEETVALTRAMVDTGDILKLEKRPVMDVHSIGGIPGNKYSLITVPIVAAAGLTIPKTSSRAITSPAGTPDIMEVLADVSFSLEEISEIVNEVGGILAWGGAVNLSPADDILVKLERPLGIDPESQLLASVLSKKISVGADRILIDIPTGLGAKVEHDEESEDLAHDFMNLGHELGVKVEAAITYGGQPLGHAIGPGLEVREALETLQGDGPNSLIEKSTSLAGILLEMSGRFSYGSGIDKAKEILESGKAYEKMKEIIEAQGGDPDVRLEDLPIGSVKESIKASRDGYVKQIYNSRIGEIARAAGSPRDKGAGVVLIHKEGRKVEEGDPLIEIYADYEKKLDEAVEIAKEKPPVRVESMLLRRVSGQSVIK